MRDTHHPELSIVIPIYNEEGILHSAVVGLVDGLHQLGHSFELILAENGSTDGTVALAQSLTKRFDEVLLLRTGEPNYGKALRRGIEKARGVFVICDEIDLCDIDFYQRALALLRSEVPAHSNPAPGTNGRKNASVDFVVGSKRANGSRDERPAFRRLGTSVMSGLLRLSVGFRGTDTHGLKAFRKETVLPVVRRCVVDRDLFASELVIRAERAGLHMTEIPVRVLEKRPPSIHLVRRVPNVLLNLGRLTLAVRRNP